jgi:hypothetical protein
MKVRPFFCEPYIIVYTTIRAKGPRFAFSPPPFPRLSDSFPLSVLFLLIKKIAKSKTNKKHTKHSNQFKIMKIVIIGGVAGGASAAARARRLSEKAEILLLQ